MGTSVKKIPKYLAIAKDLIRQIESGYFPVGSKLPTLRNLASTLNVSYLTVNSAINNLEKEGFISKRQGSGIVVNQDRKRQKYQQVGFFMPTTGHVYSSLSARIIHQLNINNIHSVPLCTMGLNVDNDLSYEEKNIEKYLNMDLKSIIISGTRFFPFKYYRKIYNKFAQTIFVLHFESDIDFPDASYVLLDHEHSGFISAEHLIKKGWKKFAVVTYSDLSENMLSARGASSAAGDFSYIRGVKKAMKKYNLDPGNLSIIKNLRRDDGTIDFRADKLVSFMDNPQCAFLCYGDTRAQRVYDLAREEGKVPGKDFGICGYYNTPWSEYLHPMLTSVSVCQESMASAIVKLVLSGETGKKIIINPKLVERNST